ncbi:hypothetical protein EVAR_69098_1 [Eumeta japonica]|uniref:Uncharacterized protein n=1 Tax=Eumeta variegata TaxID=151549 RepID=A0A4C1ZFL3_EUMVA|nr:hypothetical protein EVAR_69098_1 [Eumeta japonica]
MFLTRDPRAARRRLATPMQRVPPASSHAGSHSRTPARYTLRDAGRDYATVSPRRSRHAARLPIMNGTGEGSSGTEQPLPQMTPVRRSWKWDVTERHESSRRPPHELGCQDPGRSS